LVTYVTAVKQFYESLELLSGYCHDTRNRRLLESFSVVGWLIAISMGLAFR
jgi:hypothetical protein